MSPLAIDENENPRFDMSWHVVTLIKEWAQYINAPTFLNLL